MLEPEVADPGRLVPSVAPDGLADPATGVVADAPQAIMVTTTNAISARAPVTAAMYYAE